MNPHQKKHGQDHNKKDAHAKPHEDAKKAVEPLKSTPVRGADSRTLEGIIFVTSKGTGYLKVEGREEDIEIPPAFMNTALNRDRVRVLLHPRVPNERERGEVTEILIRNKMDFVGVVTERSGSFFLVPQDTKMYTHILLSTKRGTPTVGMKALARITSWENARENPIGEITHEIGKPGEHNVEMESILYDTGLNPSFPPEVEQDAQRVHESMEEHFDSEVKRRRDMRETTTFTIDPDDAKDFDDALSFAKLPDGSIEVGVHIADVSYFVREGTILDREAGRRATSVYMVDRTVPMLPEILSNDLCSLNPNEPKFAFSAVFKLSPDSLKEGTPVNITDTWIGETVIISDKRFAYEDAQKVLNDGTGTFFEELSTLNMLAKKLRAGRERDGAIAFEHDEVKFVLDEHGVPLYVKRKEILDTNKLIEEWMLMANKSVAQYTAKKEKNGIKHPFIYRIHDAPDVERLQTLIQFLNGLGYGIKEPADKFTSRDVNALIARAEGNAEAHMVQTAAIRTMAKAVYSTVNIGHYGLAFEHYTHFTSPIRRYPDVLVHRLLKKYLAGVNVPPEELGRYQVLAEYSSQMEKVAADAERASIKYKQVEYMSSRRGEIYEGVISGVSEWGIYVEEKETRSEGMVRLGSLKDDYYVLDKKKYAIVGERRGKAFRLGDTVKIRVEGVDMEKRIIDYRIVE